MNPASRIMKVYVKNWPSHTEGLRSVLYELIFQVAFSVRLLNNNGYHTFLKRILLPIALILGHVALYTCSLT